MTVSLPDFKNGTTVNFPDAGGFLSDSDSDGVTEGLEYALGTNPLVATDYPVTSINRGIDGRLRMRIPLDSLRPSITYAAEWSSDLDTWTSDGVEVSYSGEILSALAPASPIGGVSFLRWRVSVISTN